MTGGNTLNNRATIEHLAGIRTAVIKLQYDFDGDMPLEMLIKFRDACWDIHKTDKR